MPNMSGHRIAADIGGTFIDIALLAPDDHLSTGKLLSTPANYADAVVAGVTALMQRRRLPIGDIAEVLHGCTVATNAILVRQAVAPRAERRQAAVRRRWLQHNPQARQHDGQGDERRKTFYTWRNVSRVLYSDTRQHQHS